MRRYEQYAPSGFDWLGDLPSHWSILRAKYVFKEIDDRSMAGDEELLSVSHLTGVTPRSEKNVTMFMAEDYTGAKLCKDGDLVINTMWAWMGALGVSSSTGIVSPAYGVYRQLEQRLRPRYMDWLFRTPMYVAEYTRRSTGVNSSRLRLYPDRFLDMPVVLPPIEEQDDIVAFLDQKTSDVDAAIAKKVRLIELLQEQKVIAFDKILYGCATNGMHDVRETGNCFISKVGSDVELIQLGRLCNKLADGPHFSPSYVEPEDGYLFLSAGNIRANKFLLDDVKYVSKKNFLEFGKRVRPEMGDVLYTKGGTTGVAKFVDLDVPFQVWVHIAVLKIRSELVDGRYLAYALNSTGCYVQSQLFTRGATNKDLGLTRMKNIYLPIRSLGGQQEVVKQLDGLDIDFEQAEKKIREEIDLLTELKVGVIAAATTGAIRM